MARKLRCSQKTKDGKKCTRTCKNKYCWQHRGGAQKKLTKCRPKNNTVECLIDGQWIICNKKQVEALFECVRSGNEYLCNNAPKYICPIKSGSTGASNLYGAYLKPLYNVPDIDSLANLINTNITTIDSSDKLPNSSPLLIFIRSEGVRLGTTAISHDLFEPYWEKSSGKIIIIALQSGTPQTTPKPPDDTYTYGSNVNVPLVALWYDYPTRTFLNIADNNRSIERLKRLYNELKSS